MYAAHTTALVPEDGAALDEGPSAFARIGVNLLATEAAAKAACEGAHTPALDLLTQPPDLTPREHEIAGLAAQGLSSRAVAERIVISVRTVDNALQHVYRKLGPTSREELRLAISRPEPEPTDERI